MARPQSGVRIVGKPVVPVRRDALGTSQPGHWDQAIGTLVPYERPMTDEQPLGIKSSNKRLPGVGIRGPGTSLRCGTIAPAKKDPSDRHNRHSDWRITGAFGPSQTRSPPGRSAALAGQEGRHAAPRRASLKETPPIIWIPSEGCRSG
jgi:hypothetical protein